MSARARARGVLAFLYTLALPAVLSFAASSRRRLFVAFSSAIALTTCGKSFLNACGFTSFASYDWVYVLGIYTLNNNQCVVSFER